MSRAAERNHLSFRARKVVLRLFCGSGTGDHNHVVPRRRRNSVKVEVVDGKIVARGEVDLELARELAGLLGSAGRRRE